MEQERQHIVAFDCGNSSVRVVSGLYDGQKVELHLIHQVEHSEIEVHGIYYWDVLFIFNELQKGLCEAYARFGDIHSCGICTWGIDFGILGKEGHLLGNPLCYRNGMGARIIARLDEAERRQAFFDTGIHNHQMNSLYQLAAYQEAAPAQYAAAEKLLLMPDLLVYLFTGEMLAERTIASTTQYYDVQTLDYSKKMLQKHGIRRNLLAPFVEHGAKLGCLLPEIAARLHINQFPFVCVPSHDTACAVAAVPAAAQEEFLFISSGTWGLIGTELQHPQVDEAVFAGGLANEAGAYNTITLLKNGPGMYIAQRIRSELRQQGESYSWDTLVQMAKDAADPGLLFNVDHESLFAPSSMIQAIRALLAQTGQRADCSAGSLLRAFYNSIALSYRQVVEDIARTTGKRYEKVHIIGGGGKNAFLNQLAADAMGKTVIAGPVEATSLGNLCVQIAGAGKAAERLPIVRAISRASTETTLYQPTQNKDADYAAYLKLVAG